MITSTNDLEIKRIQSPVKIDLTLCILVTLSYLVPKIDFFFNQKNDTVYTRRS